MRPTRTSAIVTAVMLILALLAALVAAEVVPDLEGSGFLAVVADSPSRISAAALLYLLAAGTSVGVALALYSVLRHVNATLAMSSVIFRTIEAAMYMLAVVLLLGLTPLARQVELGVADLATTQTVAGVMLDLRDLVTLAGVLAFVVGAFIYYALLLRSGLVPRWLSGWGAAGALLMMLACVLSLVTGTPITGYAWAVLPIALQEAVLAVWLLVKGFRTDLIPASFGIGSLRPGATSTM